ncbi:MAG: hypothetical protein H6741_30420 [Alphaproteobacteria bacterium]|nr:hypothetical protein [Alphaproteobacteria bacterium]
MLLALLAPLAQAAPPVELLPALTDEAQLSALVVCSPVGSLARAASGMPALPLMAQGAEDPQRAAALIELATPKGLEAAGVAPDGALTLALPTEGAAGQVWLDFAGSPAQADALVTRLLGERLITPEPTDPALSADGAQEAAAEPPTSWSYTRKIGDELGTVRLTDGALGFDFPPPPADSGAALPPALFVGLPTAEGCVVAANTGRKANRPIDGMAVFMPIGGAGPMLIRAASPEAAAQLSRAGAAPMLATSTDAPTLLLTLDLPVEQLLRLGPVQEQLAKRGLDAGALDQSPLLLGAGASVAVFDIQNPGPMGMMDPSQISLSWVAAVPATSRSGEALRPRLTAFKARRELKKRDLDVSREGGKGFAVTTEGKTVHVRVQRDRLLIGNAPERLDQAVRGEGEPWGGPEHVQFAQDWALALTAPGLSEQAGAPMSIFVGARSVDALVEVSMDLQSPMRSSLMGIAMGGAMAGLGTKLDEVFKEVESQLEEAPPPSE